MRSSAGSPADLSVKSPLDAIEVKRSAAEAQMLDHATSEVGEVTDVVVAELEK